jgi:hypothetical protein
MGDQPEPSTMLHERETMSSPVPAGQRSPVVIITTSAIGVQEHVTHDPPEPGSSLHEHEITDSPLQAGQLSPVVLIPTPIMPQTLKSGTQSSAEAASTPHDSGPPQDPSWSSSSALPPARAEIAPAVSTGEPSMSVSLNSSSPPREHDAMSSQTPPEQQLSSATTNTAPTVSTADSSLSDQPERSSSAHEHGTIISQAPTKPQLPFTGTTRKMPKAVESGIQLSKDPVWTPKDSTRMQAPPPSSPTSVSRVVKLPPSPSSPVSVSRLVKLPPLPKPVFTFPIMKLPPELRLMVFDQLFLDLTVRRQRSMMSRNEVKLLEKYQVNDFRPYTNLLLTCKELGQEAKKHWMTMYLHQCCFYFWHVSKLYDLAQVLDKLGKPYTEINYVLRSQYNEGHVGDFCPATRVRELVNFTNWEHMAHQPGVSPDYSDPFDKYFQERRFPVDETTGMSIETREGVYEATDKNPVRAVVGIDGAGKKFTHAEWSGPESCTVSAHGVDIPVDGGSEGARWAFYNEMQGKFSGIFWGSYDPALGYGVFKIWEALPMRHHANHNYCQKWDDRKNQAIREEMLSRAKSERENLLSYWYDTITKDSKWLMLGGEHRDYQDFLDEYQIGDWLDDEEWSDLADEHWNHWYISGPWTGIRPPPQ